jgi:asparagine synthase (glutamine-hydrolysing)
MSGFAGVIRLDGRPADAADGARLRSAIAHRGGDANGAWSEGSALLVHAMLQTTPESRTEPQPHVESDIVVAADIRLDSSSGDAALVAAAYRRWGADCARHLDGDFAFALFDRATGSLLCARDAFGVKPLVYAHVPGKLFAFASEVRALLALAEVPRDVDEKRIADFLTIHFDDFERTFFRAIRRLPGGCTLTLRDGTPKVTRWWSPQQIRPLPRATDAEYAEGFREHFVRAVRACMRVPDVSQLAAMLSGGLDSSAIACTARDELAGAAPLPVFSWIFSDVPEADEREYQEVVAAGGGFTRHVIDSATASFSPWSDLDRLLPDGPPYAPNHYLNHGAATIARSLGIRTMLDGLGGDSSISRGGARFVELFVHGRALTLVRELRAFAAVNGGSASRTFVTHVLAPLTPPAAFRLYRAIRRRPQPDGHARFEPHLSVRSEHIAHLQSPMLAEGLELFDRVMALAGVEGRYPFFDRRLVEYCVSLPADQKLAGGYSRVVARRAMAGIVPDAVRWRNGKGKPGLHIIMALRADHARLDELFLRQPDVLAPYIDIDALRDLYRGFLEARSPDLLTAIRLWSAAATGLWLRQLG